MDPTLLAALVGAGAALLGGLIGGLIAHRTALTIADREWKKAVREQEISTRWSLYSEFVAAVANYAHSEVEGSKSVEPYRDLLTLHGRIQFVASKPMCDASADVVERAGDIAKNGARSQGLLKNFMALGREELEQLKSQPL
jgi:gas vesicle protein